MFLFEQELHIMTLSGFGLCAQSLLDRVLSMTLADPTRTAEKYSEMISVEVAALGYIG